MHKRTSTLQTPLSLSTTRIHQVYLLQEFFFNRTLSGPRVSPESTCARPSLVALFVMWHTAGKRNYAPPSTTTPTRSAFLPLTYRSQTP